MADLNLPAKSDQTVRGLFENSIIQEQIARALPSFLSAEKLTRIMLTLFRTNKKLLDCSQQSLLACFFGCAQLGLTPEPWLGQAYLVPFWNTKLRCLEATLIPGYRGLITLARRSGEIETIQAAVVYENEPFVWDRTDVSKAQHGYVDTDPGAIKGAWTIWHHKNGFKTGEYMALWEIDKIMNKTKSRNKAGEIVGPWVDDKPEMAKKTVIRRHFKLAPVSVEDKRMAIAVQAENLAIGKGPGAQSELFLPEVTTPEPIYRVEDFDKEFADIMKNKVFKKFWDGAVAHYREQSNGEIGETEVKVNVMAAGPEKLRADFERHVKAEKAKNAKATDKKSAPKKTTASQKKKALDALYQSDEWQEYLFLKSDSSDIWKDETGGKEPVTIEECVDVNDRIQARLDALDN